MTFFILKSLLKVLTFWSLGGEVTISAQKESRPPHGKLDPEDKESGRQVKRKRNEDEMEGKEQKQKNASETKGGETKGGETNGQSVGKKAKSEAEVHEKKRRHKRKARDWQKR